MGSGDIEMSFVIPNGVLITGGFSGGEKSAEQSKPSVNVTVLSGDLLSNDLDDFVNHEDNARAVAVVQGGARSSRIEGVTIRGGQGSTAPTPARAGGITIEGGVVELRHCTLEENTGFIGGSIYCGNGTDVRIRDCHVRRNRSHQWGGAIALVDSFGLVMERTVCAGNEALGSGGVLHGSGAVDVELRDVSFLQNRAAGAFASGGALALQGSALQGAGALSMVRCRFIGNESTNAGAVSLPQGMADLVVARDCVFVGNRALVSGGAAISSLTHLALIRCTLAGNSYLGVFGPSFQGGGAVNCWGVLYVRDSIVWGNDSPLIAGNPAFSFPPLSGVAQICYSDVQSLDVSYCGVTSIDTDPRFVDLDGPDDVLGTADDSARLAPDSPCIDAGDPEALVTGVDSEGMPRLLDGNLDGTPVLDMGASEFANVEVDVIPDAVKKGEVVQVVVDGEAGLLGMLFVAAQRGSLPYPPFGELLFDPLAGWVRIELGRLPSGIASTVPADLAFTGDLILQCLVIDPATGFGNLSNAVTLEVEE
jgi:hypothetical protein